MVPLDGVELAPIEHERGDLIGHARGRDAPQSRVVGHRGLGGACRLLARLAHRAIRLGANDRRPRLFAIERRFHVIGTHVVAVDRDHHPLGRDAALRRPERRRDGGGHDPRLDDQAAHDRVGG